jgi:SRSO17 transposase
VYCTYAAEAGHGLIDRDLYVPKTWCSDPERMRAAGLAPDHTFATKPQLAKAQAERAVVAGLDLQWAAGYEVYGRSTELRAWLAAGVAGRGFNTLAHRAASCAR